MDKPDGGDFAPISRPQLSGMTKGLCGCRCAASADLASSRGTAGYIRPFCIGCIPPSTCSAATGPGRVEASAMTTEGSPQQEDSTTRKPLRGVDPPRACFGSRGPSTSRARGTASLGKRNVGAPGSKTYSSSPRRIAAATSTAARSPLSIAPSMNTDEVLRSAAAKCTRPWGRVK
jgi:hypothetical protein